MQKKAVALVLAVGLALAGTIALVAFVNGAEDRALEGEELVDVYVVTDRITAGTPAAELEDHLSTEQVPDKVRVADAVVDLQEITDLVATVDLLPGEQLTRSRFIDANDYTSEFVATSFAVPDDLLQVTLSLEPERALGGAIQPGDTVAVVSSFEPFTFSAPTLPDGSTPVVELDGYLLAADGETPNTTHIILHHVLVTNVQLDDNSVPDTTDDDDEATTGPAASPGGSLLVTLAVDAPSAERIVFTAEHGTVWLALDPETAPSEGTKVWTRAGIYQVDGRNDLFAQVGTS